MTPAEHFERYQPLARKMAHNLARRLPISVQRDDLVNAALLGLWKAVNRGKSAQYGERYENYLATCIRGSLLDELRTQDWSPRRSRDARHDIQMTSLDGLPFAEGFPAFRVESTAQSDLEQLEKDFDLVRRMGKLPKRDRRVLVELLSGTKQKDLAVELGVSAPRVSQIVSETITRLRRIR